MASTTRRRRQQKTWRRPTEHSRIELFGFLEWKANSRSYVGTYLLDCQRFDDAIPSFVLAVEAKRNKARHLAYFNLGRVYVAKGPLVALASSFRRRWIEPRYALASQVLESLRVLLN
jgi:hypothetical protein